MKLNKDLDLELSQGYRQKNIVNFVTIEKFFNYLSDDFKNHLNDKHVHNAVNIDYNHTMTVKDRLDWILVLIRNIVENNNGDGIIEVTDARVTIDGQKKETLRERIDYEVEKLSRISSYENDGLMTKNDRLEMDSYVTINPLLLTDSTYSGQDISPLIQKALNRVEGNGATILIPDGEYTWDKSVDLVSNVHIIFGLNAKIKKTYRGDLFYGSSFGRQGYDAGVSNILLEGGYFIGDAEKGFDLISSFHHASRCTFKNMIFYNTGSSHTFDLVGCENITFESCQFIGFRNTNNNNHKEAIQLDHSYRQGTSSKELISSFDGLPTRKVTINKCSFLPIKDEENEILYYAPNITGQHRSIIGNNPSWIKITNNIITDAVPMGTKNEWLSGWIHLRGVQHLEISNNQFNALNVKAPCRAIQLYRTSSNLMMEDITKASPTATLSSPEPLDMVIIRDNIFKNFTNTTDKPVINIEGTKFDNTNYFCRFIEISNNSYEWMTSTNTTNVNNVGQTTINLSMVRHSTVYGNSCRLAKTFIKLRECNSVSVDANNLESMKYAAIIVKSDKTQGLNRFISIKDNKSMRGTTLAWFNRVEGLSIINNQVHDLIGLGSSDLTSAIAGADEIYKSVITGNSIEGRNAKYTAIRIQGFNVNSLIQGNVIANIERDIAFRSGAHILNANNLTWNIGG